MRLEVQPPGGAVESVIEHRGHGRSPVRADRQARLRDDLSGRFPRHVDQPTGDDQVAGQVAEYRRSLAERQAWTARLGWLTPAAAVQTLAHRIADSDLQAHLAYQDSIGAFPERLRAFCYPYIFNDRPFDRADFDALPTYAPRESSASTPATPLIGLLVLCVAAILAALGSMRRLRSRGAAPIRRRTAEPFPSNTPSSAHAVRG